MRIIVHGVGAVGGAVAAALALAGREVVGIARGSQLTAIRSGGLKLRTPGGTQVARFECVGDPAEIDWREDDAIVLATKTQDTAAALAQLVAAGVARQPIFCAQNGVENERMALRWFPNVHGITLLMPAEYLTPGEVAVFGAPRLGIFDIGRYPRGSDDADRRLAEALEAAGIASFVEDDVMLSKYGKLVQNLGNIVEAALGRETDREAILARIRDEGRAVLAAMGIAPRDMGAGDPRRGTYMSIVPIEGVRRTGGSSTQSLARAAGSIETDYLNGEIVLQGRLHGIPTPANAWLMALSTRLVREGAGPGSVSRQQVEAALGL